MKPFLNWKRLSIDGKGESEKMNLVRKVEILTKKEPTSFKCLEKHLIFLLINEVNGSDWRFKSLKIENKK